MAKVGRNDPCPCGSGVKYKKCCLPKERKRRREHSGRVEEAERERERMAEEEQVVLERFRMGPFRSTLPRSLAEEVEGVFEALEDRGVVRAGPEAAVRAQERFERRARARWEDADDDPDRMKARKILAGQAEEMVDGWASFEREFGAEADLLVEPGEAGVPHLAVVLMTPSEASILAAQGLSGMKSGTLRNRALAEALFVDGGLVNDVAIRAFHRLDDEDARWEAFEATARWAGAEGLELQGSFWTGLFEDRPRDAALPIRPRPRFGDALQLLYDHGHRGAVHAGFRAVLDPGMAGPLSVKAFIEDAGVRRTVEAVRERAPGTEGTA